MADSGTVHLRMLLPASPWTLALAGGTLDEPGLSWDVRLETALAPQRFEATVAGGYDVGEGGLRQIALEISAGRPARGIPVFLGREHMQRNFFVRADSPLQGLRDLAGKRVGSNLPVSSGTGAGVMMVLEQGYGIDLHTIQWRCGRELERLNPMGLDLLPGPKNQEELFQAVLRGDLDVGFSPGGPRYWSLFGGTGDKLDVDVGKHAGVRLLANDPDQIADQYRRTGLYPITDIATVDPELARGHPDLSDRLVSLFSKANALASRHRLPEEQQLAEREIGLLGEDPHHYGLTAGNRANLGALLDFYYRIGSIERALDPEELFV